MIRKYGDAALSEAIADGMAKGLRQDDRRQLRADCAELRARKGIRAYVDVMGFRQSRKAMARRYATEAHGRAYTVALVVWAVMWMWLFRARERMLGL